MSVLVVWLSCLPCGDFAPASIATDDSSSSVANDKNESSDEHSDSCSPFCQCMCCAGFSISHSIASFSDAPVPQSRQYTSFMRTDLQEIPLPIWEPPQLI